MPRINLFRLMLTLVICTVFLCFFVLIPEGGLNSIKVIIRLWSPTPTSTVKGGNLSKVRYEEHPSPGDSKAAEPPPPTENPSKLKEILTRVEKIQAQRQKNIVDACESKGKKELNYKNMHYFIYNDKYKVIYCYVPKVACTEWKKVMMILDGHSEKNFSKIAHGQAHEGYTYRRLVDLPTDEAKRRLDTYYKFMFVREPFERLLSAYRDKLGQYNLYFAETYGNDILRRYRKNPDVNSLKTGNRVTFKEFIQYIVDGHFDEHWMRMVDLCMPCNIKFDFIGKFETLADDHKYILEKANLGDLIQFPAIRPSKTSKYILKYFTDIPKENLKELGKIYDRDFAFYNYSYPGPIKPLLDE